MKKHSFGSLLFIGLVLIIMYLPIAVVVVYSFNANTARIPIDFTGWTIDWYAKLFEGRSGFGDALLLSVKVALWAVVISCVIGTLGAIGMANHRNPISILIPCHRVVGTNGSLTGYAGGIEKKIQLLTLEKCDMHSFIIPK